MLFGAVDESAQLVDVYLEVVSSLEAVDRSTNAALLGIPGVTMHIDWRD
jgi:hypothetical protein